MSGGLLKLLNSCAYGGANDR